MAVVESSRKVLVVEPDSLTRREIKQVCEQDGYQVLEADSAAVSCCPRVSDSSGTASGIKMARAARAAKPGRRATPRARTSCMRN